VTYLSLVDRLQNTGVTLTLTDMGSVALCCLMVTGNHRLEGISVDRYCTQEAGF
jgi:hypothetical protein